MARPQPAKTLQDDLSALAVLPVLLAAIVVLSIRLAVLLLMDSIVHLWELIIPASQRRIRRQ